ncbi:hypothetical protein [Pseudotabrizicola sp. 4114]|uniref:hypothetical protein n=1 Tax=Pseudotabrizicola sp. 4114 TaxID=2817731 RepID=UPI00285E3690|nr:putative phiE125 gp8 family phage protein [Pseudorhodobacter sp. 4114]
MQVIGEAPQAVSVAAFKRAVMIAEDDTDHDVALTAYLAAAQEVVETAARRPLTPRVVQFTTWAGLGLRWWVPLAPVSAVTAVAYDDGSDWVDVLPAEFRLVQGFDEPQVLFTDAAFAGLSCLAGLRITATVGHVTPPKGLMQAVILLAKDWFDTGVAVEDHKETALNFGCRSLIRQARYVRPREWGSA